MIASLRCCVGLMILTVQRSNGFDSSKPFCSLRGGFSAVRPRADFISGHEFGAQRFRPVSSSPVRPSRPAGSRLAPMREIATQ